MVQTSSAWGKFGFYVQFDLAVQGQFSPKTTWILTKLFCISAPNLVILASMGDELWHGQTRGWRTHIHTPTQAKPTRLGRISENVHIKSDGGILCKFLSYKYFGGFEGCWIQICCMTSWKIATNASKSRNPRWPPSWGVKFLNIHIVFTKHDINLNKTWFSMFSDIRNPLPYSVWW